MKIPLRLALALLPILLLAGCNLFNAPAMEVAYYNDQTLVVQNSGTLTVPYTHGSNRFLVLNQSYRTIAFTGNPRVQISGSGAFSYSDSSGGLPGDVAESSTVDFYITFNYGGTAYFKIPTDKGDFYFTLKSP